MEARKSREYRDTPPNSKVLAKVAELLRGKKVTLDTLAEIRSEFGKGNEDTVQQVWDEYQRQLEEAIKIAKCFIELIAGKQRKNHVIYWHGMGKPKWAY